MLSDKQRQTALKKNSALARNMARRLIADGVEEVTLTYYADEGSFHAMRLPEEGTDFEHRQRTNAEIAKVMLAHGLDLKVQVLNLSIHQFNRHPQSFGSGRHSRRSFMARRMPRVNQESLPRASFAG